MELKFFRLDDKAVLPNYAYALDCALDLTAITQKLDNDIVTYGTGLAVEIPSGYAGLILPRSSVNKTGLLLANSVGLIDVGYTGELLVKFRKLNDNIYVVGDRVAQLLLVPIPKITPIWSDKLTFSVRGAGGFGSSGR